VSKKLLEHQGEKMLRESGCEQACALQRGQKDAPMQVLPQVRKWRHVTVFRKGASDQGGARRRRGHSPDRPRVQGERRNSPASEGRDGNNGLAAFCRAGSNARRSQGGPVKNADAQREGITAHERRAQVIAQLHKQAISAGNDQASRSEAKIAEIVRVMRQRRVKGWLFVAAMTVFAIACIAAVVGTVSIAR
jgi:hypothetical protein